MLVLRGKILQSQVLPIGVSQIVGISLVENSLQLLIIKGGRKEIIFAHQILMYRIIISTGLFHHHGGLAEFRIK